MKKFLTEARLKKELTPEQFERFQIAMENDGIEAALSTLPSMGGNVVMNVTNARIKELRLEHGLTQVDVANVLDVSQREYWRYEQSGYSVNIMFLAQLAVFYNVSLDWFSGYHQTKKPFFEGAERTSVNGYVLADMKDAKARGEKYLPQD